MDVPTVLIIDDDETNRKLISRLLVRNGFEVQTASSGQGGLEILANVPVSVVLLDIVMPKEHGLDILQRIKDNPALRHIPVVMLSIVEHEKTRNQAFALGACRFMEKPYNLREILSVLREVLDEHPCRGTSSA
ncbi:response regulator [Desulfovibrio inopinatus]|uniref:response regulator n=1 Tax=Desulfovibrio inopinatus TaxID=102109 RepID=UPI00040BFF1A|nr:response regulator [Desulfovibrio inopinatus]